MVKKKNPATVIWNCEYSPVFAVSDFWLAGILFNRETIDYVMLIKNTESLLRQGVRFEAVSERNQALFSLNQCLTLYL